MTKKEILLKQRNAENAPLTDYIGTDGYVWKMIENAMEEYHQAKLKLLGLADVVGRSEQFGDVSENEELPNNDKPDWNGNCWNQI